MNKNFNILKSLINSVIFLHFSCLANAQPNCIKVDQIAKWEVLDNTKTIIYDNQGSSIAFVIFDGYTSYLKKSGENFRFFSPSICRGDRVQVTNGMSSIIAIEAIRK